MHAHQKHSGMLPFISNLRPLPQSKESCRGKSDIN